MGGAAIDIEKVQDLAVGFNAARGFVGGAARRWTKALLTEYEVSMPHAALWVVQPDSYPESLVGVAVSMPHAALWVVQPSWELSHLVARLGFNAARGFVGGAALHGGRHALFTASFNAARGYSLSPPPPLRGPPPPLAQGRLG